MDAEVVTRLQQNNESKNLPYVMLLILLLILIVPMIACQVGLSFFAWLTIALIVGLLIIILFYHPTDRSGSMFYVLYAIVVLIVVIIYIVLTSLALYRCD